MDIQSKNGLKRWWNNVVRLIRVKLLQSRIWYFIVLLMELGFCVLNVFITMQLIHDDGRGFHTAGYGQLSFAGIVIGVAVICIKSSDGASDRTISMYPGTRSSRYLARLLCDHILLLLHTLYAAALYLLFTGVFYLIRLTKPAIDMKFFFSWKYMLAGCIRILLMSLMIYAMVQFCYIVLYRMGLKWYLPAYVILFCTGTVLVGVYKKDYMKIFEYFFSSYFNRTELVSRTLVSWMLFLAIAMLLVIFGKKNIRPVSGATGILVLSVFVGGMGLEYVQTYKKLSRDADSYRHHYAESTENQENLVRYFTIDLPQGDKTDFFEYIEEYVAIYKYKNSAWSENLCANSTVRTLSDWQKDSDNTVKLTVTENSAVMQLSVIDIFYDGKSLFKDFFDGIQITRNGNTLYYDAKTSYCVFNFMFGNAYYLAGMTTEDMSFWINYNSFAQGEMSAVILLDDKTGEEWKEYQRSSLE